MIRTRLDEIDCARASVVEQMARYEPGMGGYESCEDTLMMLALEESILRGGGHVTRWQWMSTSAITVTWPISGREGTGGYNPRLGSWAQLGALREAVRNAEACGTEDDV